MESWPFKSNRLFDRQPGQQQEKWGIAEWGTESCRHSVIENLACAEILFKLETRKDGGVETVNLHILAYVFFVCLFVFLKFSWFLFLHKNTNCCHFTSQYWDVLITKFYYFLIPTKKNDTGLYFSYDFL